MELSKILAKGLNAIQHKQIMKRFQSEEDYTAASNGRHVYNCKEGALLWLGGSFSSGKGYIEVMDTGNPTLPKAKRIIEEVLN